MNFLNFCFILIILINKSLRIDCSSDEIEPIYENKIDELSEKDKFNLHHAFVREKDRWPFGIVYFKMSDQFTVEELEIIFDSMTEIEEKSCVKFIEHEPKFGPSYIKITKYDGVENECYSTKVGRSLDGPQIVNLGPGCISSNICQHELLHALGFYHHHSRSDRNEYLKVNYENVIDGEQVQFDQLLKYDKNFKHVTKFDYQSIMIYGQKDFSKNKKLTMSSKKKKNKKISPSTTLTKYDKMLLNRFYLCKSNDF